MIANTYEGIEILNICRASNTYDEFGNVGYDLPDDVEIIKDGDPYGDEEYIIQMGTHIARIEFLWNQGVMIETGNFKNVNNILDGIRKQQY